MHEKYMFVVLLLDIMENQIQAWCILSKYRNTTIICNQILTTKIETHQNKYKMKMQYYKV